MKNIKILSKTPSKMLCLVTLALVAVGAQAETARLLPVADGDLVAPSLTAASKAGIAVAPGIPGVSREAVSFTFPVEANTALASAPAPYETRSLEYFVEVSAAELRAGATIYTTAPNALVRINPSASEQLKGGAAELAVLPSSLVIRTAAGDELRAADATSQLVDAEQMKATGVPFAAGTTAFRLSPAVGVGALTLSAPDLRSDATYAIHVFDKESDAVLSLQAAAMDFFHGQDLRIHAHFEDAAGRFATDQVQGFVTSPSGDAWPVSWAAGDRGQMSASLPLDAIQGAGPGLWELHMAASGDRDGLTVMRNATTAFAVHVPTAALNGDVRVLRQRGLTIDLGVSVAEAGRYEVRGVIFGTDTSGALVPFAAAHSANWLQEDGHLTLSVEADLLRQAGVRAPYEVRDLRLMDQGRMGVLHRQARGIEIR